MNDTVTLLTRRADLAPASANCDDRTVEVICKRRPCPIGLMSS